VADSAGAADVEHGFRGDEMFSTTGIFGGSHASPYNSAVLLWALAAGFSRFADRVGGPLAFEMTPQLFRIAVWTDEILAPIWQAEGSRQW